MPHASDQKAQRMQAYEWRGKRGADERRIFVIAFCGSTWLDLHYVILHSWECQPIESKLGVLALPRLRSRTSDTLSRTSYARTPASYAASVEKPQSNRYSSSKRPVSASRHCGCMGEVCVGGLHGSMDRGIAAVKRPSAVLTLNPAAHLPPTRPPPAPASARRYDGSRSPAWLLPLLLLLLWAALVPVSME